MPELIAQGPHPENRWRRRLVPAKGEDQMILGRTASPWSTPWDDRISRQHATLQWVGRQLQVTKLGDARNPIFYRGSRRDQFRMVVGEHFVIGQTTFSLVEQRVEMSEAAPAVTEQAFAASDLRQVRYRDADRRIDVLGRLPEIIEGSSTDEELWVRIVNVLLQGIPGASFAAVVAVQPSQAPAMSGKGRGASVDVEAGSKSEQIGGSVVGPVGGPAGAAFAGEDRSDIQVLHWDCRSLAGVQFSPSSRLIRQATTTGQSVLHQWSRSDATGRGGFTQSEQVDWAFCTPIISDACQGWGLYIAGDLTGLMSSAPDMAARQPTDYLRDDLKFAELVATTLASLQQVRMLQRRQDSLRTFFAPIVLSALAGQDPEQVLAPRETSVSVLFCDLRGFSKQSEESSENLMELLNRVSGALGVMTHHILEQGGVVGDFHGDAAMGFWGWPISGQHTAEQACLAALGIRRAFIEAASQTGHSLSGFQVGIGIATGPAVAGRIGTTDQVKVTVFGPVVNLASRLEGMTKQLCASVLMDEVTAQAVRSTLPASLGRVRRVARVLPYGMQTPLWVSQLVPPLGPDSVLTDDHIKYYEEAVEQLQVGKWNEAFRLLHHVPAEDRVKDFLTVFIAQHGRTPPSDWNGVIRLPSK